VLAGGCFGACANEQLAQSNRRVKLEVIEFRGMTTLIINKKKLLKRETADLRITLEAPREGVNS
jgi:hypothetical protein